MINTTNPRVDVRHLRHASFLFGALVALGAGAAPSLADTLTIFPSKDNTLIQPQRKDPLASDGLGSMYCGKTGVFAGFTLRRCVLAFDVAAGLPAGSTINSASLALRLEISLPGDREHRLHKLVADWGEGTSLGMGAGSPATKGDCTWFHTFYDTQVWATPGGDFASTASATTIVGADTTIDYVWSSAQMAADVQAWLDAPATSFGWIMIGDEITNQSAKGFFSREAIDLELRPRLTIDYTPPVGGCSGDVNHSGAVDVDDLIAVILSWGCTNPPGPCEADADHSGVVDVDDLIAVILGWGPCD